MHITQNEGSDYHSEILQESIQCVSSHKLQRNFVQNRMQSSRSIEKYEICYSVMLA
jgi:hypothetical protein